MDQGERIIQVRGKPTPSRSFRLYAEKMQIDLWYSEDQQWLALESITENGGKLIYKIQ